MLHGISIARCQTQCSAKVKLKWLRARSKRVQHTVYLVIQYPSCQGIRLAKEDGKVFLSVNTLRPRIAYATCSDASCACIQSKTGRDLPATFHPPL